MWVLADKDQSDQRRIGNIKCSTVSSSIVKTIHIHVAVNVDLNYRKNWPAQRK